jgi:hypothetical protein
MELTSESTSRATPGARGGAGSATGDPAIDAGLPTTSHAGTGLTHQSMIVDGNSLELTE